MITLPASAAWAKTVRYVALALLASSLGCKPSPPPNDTSAVTDDESVEAVPANAEPVPAVADQRGAQLYAQHCAACHGERGDGRGIAAQFLFPKPRDFRLGRFRIVSTVNGVASEADVQSVLERGMPGSSMPPWSHLGEENVKLLTRHVLAIRKEGARDELVQAAQDAGDEIDEESIEATVSYLITPGEVFAVPQLEEPTAESIAAGKEIYLAKGCASCHGAGGKGDGQEKMVDAEGLPTRPRDLTLGLFKGSPDPVSVYHRIRLGMPGSPMPAAQNFPPEDIAAMVHFVLSLSDDDIRKSAPLQRRRITASAVAVAPSSPTDPSWNLAEPVPIQTIPLWWRNDAAGDLRVQALHDGESLALRLSWRDDTPDLHAVQGDAFEDAVAVELFVGDVEPFLGMGSPQFPVDVWFWDADRQHGVESTNSYPRMVVDMYPLAEQRVETAEYERPGTAAEAQPDVTLPAAAAGNPIVPYGQTAGSSLQVAGPGSVTFRPPTNRSVAAEGRWHEGRWEVVLRRALSVDTPDDGIPLIVRQEVSVAFAIWDGAHRDRDGKKLVSIWQDLVIESVQP